MQFPRLKGLSEDYLMSPSNVIFLHPSGAAAHLPGGLFQKVLLLFPTLL